MPQIANLPRRDEVLRVNHSALGKTAIIWVEYENGCPQYNWIIADREDDENTAIIGTEDNVADAHLNIMIELHKMYTRRLAQFKRVN